MQHTALTADGKTCRIRRATADDTDKIRLLIHTFSIHVTGLRKQKNAEPKTPAEPKHENTQKTSKKRLFAFFSSSVQWRNFYVAVSSKGTVVGCCQVKPHHCGTKEIDTLCIDKNWRNGTVAARLMKFVITNNPHPLWGTCLDNVVAFQKRNGGVHVTDPGMMPPVLRRRWRLFNFLMSLTHRKDHLNVMMIDNSTPTDRRKTDLSAYSPDHGANTLQATLLQRIKKYQLRKSRPFRFPGRYEAVRGLFVSYSTYTSSLLQKYFKNPFHIRIPDNNAFVTFWTLELLLDAYQDNPEGRAEIRIKEAVTALMGFHDQTREQNDPLFVFWKQRSVDGHPVVFPTNLIALSRLVLIFNSTQKKIGVVLSKIIPHKKNIGGHPSHAPPTAAFNLPADFDDAALNWSLGSCLSACRDTHPDAWSIWSQNGFDFNKLAHHAVACAYRPFSNEQEANTIDPRSFYAMRTFLWDLQDKKKDVQNFSLLTTWASTIRKNREGIHRHYKMPFNANNIDCSVQANFIHAACRAEQNNTFPRVENFESLILNTAQYLAWAVASGAILKHPDIALLYYPTPTCCFFFISRIVQLLESNRGQETAGGICTQVINILVPAARQHITSHLQSCANQTGSAAFWQRLSEKQSASPGSAFDDRKFMTAASLNCLLNLWTQSRKEGLEWLPSIPDSVQTLTAKGLAWLRQQGLSRSDHNAFFSASVKHRLSLPFAFPANMIQHTEGPALSSGAQKDHSTMRHSIYAMSGVPAREEYKRMLKEKNLDVVKDDTFQKCFDLDYPYWSAPTVTSALVVLALSKAEALGL